MSYSIRIMGGQRALLYTDGGPIVGHQVDANELIAAAWEHEAAWVVVPVSRMDEGFFRLETRMLGEFVQKFVNYGLKIAVVGNIDAWLAGSKPLRDLHYETNRGKTFWLLESVEALAEKLEGATA